MEHLLNIGAAGAKAKKGAGGTGMQMPGLDSLGLSDMDPAQLKQQADHLWRMLDEMAESDPQAYRRFVNQQAKAAVAAGALPGQAGTAAVQGPGAMVAAWQGPQKVLIHVWAAPPGASVPMPCVDLQPVTATTCAWQGLRVPCAPVKPPVSWRPEPAMHHTPATTTGATSNRQKQQQQARHLHCAVHLHCLQLVGAGAPAAFRALFHEAVCQWADTQLGATLQRGSAAAAASGVGVVGRVNRELHVAPLYWGAVGAGGVKAAASGQAGPGAHPPGWQAAAEVLLPKPRSTNSNGLGQSGGDQKLLPNLNISSAPTLAPEAPAGTSRQGSAPAGGKPPAAKGPLIQELPPPPPLVAEEPHGAAGPVGPAAGAASSPAAPGAMLTEAPAGPGTAAQGQDGSDDGAGGTKAGMRILRVQQDAATDDDEDGNGGSGTLTVEVHVPAVQRMRDLDVEFDGTCAQLLVTVLAAGAGAGHGTLSVPLPGRADPSLCRATFSANTKVLKVVARLEP